jgi:tryptophan synthase alpha chain
MSRITQIFNDLKQKNQKAFIPFITAGDGGLDVSLEIMLQFAQNGADIIEIGVPFSDPMADGPTIAASHERAVQAGVSLQDVFELVTQFRAVNAQVGIVLMGYLNPIEIYGYQQFATSCATVGVDGVLIVDNPPEEAEGLKHILDSCAIDLIFLVAPTTTDERLQKLAELISGFVYFVSLKGVTGSRAINTDEVQQNLARIQRYINMPICVGFGIKNADIARQVAKDADGVIVGSSIVQLIENNLDNKSKMLETIDIFTKEIIKVTK